jgi:hypothetical protein
MAYTNDPRVTIHDDISKKLGGKMYYLAERHTSHGAQGFWVTEDWKNKFRESG